jgi:hypothetical protein
MKREAGRGDDFMLETGFAFGANIPVVGNIISPFWRNRKYYIC